MNPSYGSLAIVGGTQDGANSAYIDVDQPLAPGPGPIANENAPARYHFPVPNLSEHDSVDITLTAARTFRVAVLSDIRNDNALYKSTGFRFRQTVGRGADSGMQTFTNDGSGGDWHVFAITGKAGDVFRLSLRASATAGETAFARLAVDSVVSPGPEIFQITQVVRDAGTGEVTLTFTSTSGAFYAVDYSDDLETWLEPNDNVPGQSGETGFTDDVIAPTAGDELYYRVRQL